MFWEKFRNNHIETQLFQSELPIDGIGEITAPVQYRVLTGGGEYKIDTNASAVETGRVEVWAVPQEPVVDYYKAVQLGISPGGFYDLISSEGKNIGTKAQKKPSTNHLIIVRTPYSSSEVSQRWQDAAPRAIVGDGEPPSTWTTDMIVSPVTITDSMGKSKPENTNVVVLPTHSVISGEIVSTPIRIAGEGYEGAAIGTNTLKAEKFPERLGAYWQLSLAETDNGNLTLLTDMSPIPLRNDKGESSNTSKQRPTHLWRRRANGDYDEVAGLIATNELTSKVLIDTYGNPQRDLSENLRLLVETGVISPDTSSSILQLDETHAWQRLQELIASGLGNVKGSGGIGYDKLAYYAPSQDHIAVPIRTGETYVFTNGTGGEYTRVLLTLTVNTTPSGLIKIQTAGADRGHEASTSSGTHVQYGFTPVQPVVDSKKKGEVYVSTTSRNFQRRPLMDGRD